MNTREIERIKKYLGNKRMLWEKETGELHNDLELLVHEINALEEALGIYSDITNWTNAYNRCEGHRFTFAYTLDENGNDIWSGNFFARRALGDED